MSNENNKKKQSILIGVIAIVCIALIGVAVFFATSGDSEKAEATDSATEAVSNAPETSNEGEGTEATQDGQEDNDTKGPEETDEPATDENGTDEPATPSEAPDASEPIENASVQNDNVANDIFAP